MENNVVNFIVENIFLFLPLGFTGIIITFYLYLTGKREKQSKEDNLDVDYINLSKFKINVYILIYLFICVMMIIIGVLSDFIVPTTIGVLLALIPIVLMIGGIKHKNNRSKVP